MNIFIYLSILLLNIVAVALTYHFLGDKLDKKTKGIFIIVGFAVICLTVSFVYFLSTKNIELEINNQTKKNLITFTFVPLNAIIILPFFAKTYNLLKLKKIKLDNFKKRCIVLAIIFLIIVIIDFFYFRQIQNGILNIIESRK